MEELVPQSILRSVEPMVIFAGCGGDDSKGQPSAAPERVRSRVQASNREVQQLVRVHEKMSGAVGSRMKLTPLPEGAQCRFEVEEMCRRFLYPDNVKLRVRAMKMFHESVFMHPLDTEEEKSLAEQRADTLLRLRRIADEFLISVSDALHDSDRLFAFFESFVTLDGSLMLQITTHLVLFGGAILNLGTEEQKARYLPAVEDNSLFGCFAYSELGHGSNIRDIETRVTYDSDSGHFILHTPTDSAQKAWVTGAASLATVAVVFAQLYVKDECHGVHGFVVTLRQPDGSLAPGIRVKPCGKTGGMQTLDMGRLWFDEVKLSRDALLSRYASVTPRGTYFSSLRSQPKRFAKFMGESVMSRMLASTGSMLAARAALYVAVSYAAKRCQFGPPGEKEVPIMSYRVHQLRLVPFLVENYALTAFSQEVKRKWQTGSTSDRSKRVAALKYATSEHAVSSVASSRRCCGAQGLLLRNIIARLHADSDIMVTLDGDNHLLLQHIAGSVLKKLGKSYADLSGTMRYYGQMVTGVVEANPLASRSCSHSHLMDHKFHRTAFQYREYHLACRLAASIEKQKEKGVTYFEAWNRCGTLVGRLGKAYITRQVHLAFVRSVKAMETTCPPLVPTLRKMCSLYALREIQKDSWFLEYEYIAPVKAKYIARLVESLSEDLSKDALGLVHAWALPGDMFEGTIAGKDWPASQFYGEARL